MAGDAAMRPLTVLIVEPSSYLRDAMAKQCRAVGVLVKAVATIAEAMDAICQGPPVAVLTALQLPGLSGASLLAALKCSPAHRDIPVALVTASESPDASLGTYQPDCVIAKDADLLDSVAEFVTSLGLVDADPAEHRATPLAPLDGVRILLCDDSSMNQALIGRILHVAGADVVAVGDGTKAVEVGCRGGLDLILMDIEMPVLDGRQATRLLRQGGVQVPIVALTAHRSEEVRAEMMAAGCDDVLSKPIDRDALVRACRRILRHASEYRIVGGSG